MKKQLHLLLFVFYCLIVQTTNAQVSSIPYAAALDNFAVISGTTIDAPFADDVFYSHIPIGFSFDYAGSSHTEMVVSCNGYIQLDTLPNSQFVNVLSGNTNNRIAAFGADLMHRDSTASLQYATFGVAPNRECIIQWSHYSYFAGQTGDVNFQIHLFETSNCISFVYGANTYSSIALQTQIGLRGTSNTDFIVLGDSTCNWANAYPYASITTQFPVSISCGMPSGFAFHFGNCGVNSGLQLFSISGNVFKDANGNGIKDSLELPIPHHVLTMSPGNNYVSSDGNGDYAFFCVDSTLTYTISTGGITYWNATTANPVAVNPQTQSTSGIDFGFIINPNVHEVTVTCPAWGAKPGQAEPMPIWYCNNGTATESDTITFVMDSLYSFISSTPSPLSVVGSTITWLYSNLAPGQCGSIHLRLMPDSTAVLGNFLNSTLTIGPLNDTIPTNNILNLHQLISNAWDPNEKVVEPQGKILAGTELTYTIHFQNTGNAIADNVIVRDTLDTNLDLLSLNIIGSSHTMNFAMDGNGIASFTFFNIQLPDSGSNFAGSNGYVSFRIKTKGTLLPQTVINNRAGIIFDSNIPVMTNIASDTIVFDLSSNIPSVKEFVLSAFPNPNNGNVIFRYSTNENETGDLTIVSSIGQVMFHQKNLHSNDAINLAGFSSGIYTAMIKTASGIKTIKIIIQ